MQKESIDLMNVDYEDVLHLYRGWRKSESALKDKDKELNMLKSKMKQLQDAHVQFRSQIHGIEAIKELTVKLQSQIASLRHENEQLVAENKELAQLNLNAEQFLQEKEVGEINSNKLLRDVQIEFATLKGRYEESIKAQHELEKVTASEQSHRAAAQLRLSQAEKAVDALREENRDLKSKLDIAHTKLSQCDQELSHASEQLSCLSKELVNISNTKDALSTAEAEIAILKADMTRLLRLLEFSPATKDFVMSWMDSGGLHFAGSGINTSASRNFDAINQNISKALDNEEITPAEFEHLKRIHGRDPFPMSGTMQEESEYWVPKEAAELGVHFLRTKFPQTPPTVIMEFLRNMNKIWLRRERRKIRRVKEVMSSTIEDLKRQLSQTRPYNDVLAERQIKRLKSQVKSDRNKMLTGRARKKLEQHHDETEIFEDVDYMEFSSSPHHSRRLCRRAHTTGDKNITEVSTEKFLQASLSSLQSINHQITPAYDYDFSHSQHKESEDGSEYPSKSYLRGALWIGRNMVLLTEEMVELVEDYKLKFLSDMQDIGTDNDLKRLTKRLTLHATTGIHHICNLVSNAKNQIRDVLQGTSAIEPSNTAKFQEFLRRLPIESALVKPNLVTDYQNLAAETSIPNYHDSLKRSPNRSIRFTSGIDSPLYASELYK